MTGKLTTLSDLTDEKAKQIGRYIDADAVIIAIIPNMGKRNPLNTYFEEIVIRAVSVKTGKVIWNAKLVGNVDAEPDKFEHTLLLDTIESKLYDDLENMLRMPPRP